MSARRGHGSETNPRRSAVAGNRVFVHIIAAGVSGFLGKALVSELTSAGHHVTRLVRHPATGPDEVTWDPDRRRLDRSTLAGADAVINLCGVGVGDKRWTSVYKQQIVSSRVNPTALLAEAVAAEHVPVLINASAIGFYGPHGDEPLDEESPSGQGFFPDCCTAWENATTPAEQGGARVVRLRTGLVLGPDGGLLPQLELVTKLFAGGKLGSGKQFYSWIARTDWWRAVEFLLTHEVSGAVNLTAPHPERNVDFVKAIGRQVHRPTPWPIPEFALRLVLGEFAGDVVTGQRVLPLALLKSGFDFEFPELAGALAAESKG